MLVNFIKVPQGENERTPRDCVIRFMGNTFHDFVKSASLGSVDCVSELRAAKLDFQMTITHGRLTSVALETERDVYRKF